MKPTILTVDDDPMVSAAISRDLRTRYGSGYRVVGTTSGEQALSVLAELTPMKLRTSVMSLLLEPAERVRTLEALLLAKGADADLPPGGTFEG